MANQFTKFEVSSFSRSGDILGGSKKLNGSRDHNHAPFGGNFFICFVRLDIAYRYTKFEISMFTQYKDMKGDEKCKNLVMKHSYLIKRI